MMIDLLSYISIYTVAGLVGFSTYIITQLLGLDKPKHKFYLSTIFVITFFLTFYIDNHFNHENLIPLQYKLTAMAAISTYCFVKFFNAYIWTGLIFKRYKVPSLIMRSANTIIYFASFVLIMKFIHNEPISHYIALSGGAAFIITYSAKNTFSQIFSGIAINLGGNLKKGHFITVDKHTGIVYDMDWRSITIRDNVHNSLVVIPNSEFTRKSFINYSKISGYRFKWKFKLYGNADINRIIPLVIDAFIQFGFKREDFSNPILKKEKDHFTISVLYKKFKPIPGYHNNTEITQVFCYVLKKNNILVDQQTFQILENNNPSQYIEPKDKYDKLQIINILRMNKELNHIDDPEMELIIKFFTISEYPPHCAIYHQGETGNHLYFILEGECYSSTKIKNKEVIINSFKKSQVFGVTTFLYGKARRTTVTAKNNVIVATVHRNDLENINKKIPSFGEDLARILAERKIKQMLKEKEVSESEIKKQKKSFIHKFLKVFQKCQHKEIDNK